MSRSLFGIAAAAVGLFAAPLCAQVQVDAPDTGTFDGVFVEQIGERNEANFDLSANAQNAEVRQDGDDNFIEVTQNGTGDHYAGLTQTGNANIVGLTQTGDAQNVALITQTGDGNNALLAQNDTGLIGSGAAITQSGAGNNAALVQDGSDNQAILTQTGDNNTMTATQLGDGNELEWIQNGNNLPDMMIIQTGGASAVVSQGG